MLSGLPEVFPLCHLNLPKEHLLRHWVNIPSIGPSQGVCGTDLRLNYSQAQEVVHLPALHRSGK